LKLSIDIDIEANHSIGYLVLSGAVAHHLFNIIIQASLKKAPLGQSLPASIISSASALGSNSNPFQCCFLFIISAVLVQA